MVKVKNFWTSPSMKQVSPNPKLKLPKSHMKYNYGNESYKLVKTATHLALAGAALGIGLAAYDSVSS